MVLPITLFSLFLGVIFAATTANAGVIDFKKLLNASDANAADVDEFAGAMEKFKFERSNASDVRRRLGHFRKTKKNIEGLRTKFKNAKFGVNKFSLMSTEEKQQFLGATTPDESPSDPREKRSALDNLISTNIPDEYDFRAVGKVTPVKNQKKCGSCYAFAATATVESQYLLRFNQTLDLSEQNIVSCYKKCSGGDPIYTLKYIQKNGISTESCQPYVASSDVPCPAECNNQKYYIGGYHNFGKNESTYAAQLYNYGPATVIVYVPESFMSYKSGVIDFPAAECKLNSLGKHAMVIVGYTPDYWIIKNSWGPDWGENGFVRVKRGQNYCHMNIQENVKISNNKLYHYNIFL
uniref:Peptidase C1A papain C-terminal domain-containing protein n=1 Tax=Panagrolaimus sp. ES5 TaxID=591445 RepID=A0AC34GUY5_9BILA